MLGFLGWVACDELRIKKLASAAQTIEEKEISLLPFFLITYILHIHPPTQRRTAQNDGLPIVADELVALDFEDADGHIEKKKKEVNVGLARRRGGSMPGSIYQDPST